jgi:predicted metalloenzyme YecM
MSLEDIDQSDRRRDAQSRSFTTDTTEIIPPCVRNVATVADNFLDALKRHVPKFLASVVSRLYDDHLIDWEKENLVPDHVCWRTETVEEYSNLVEALLLLKKNNDNNNSNNDVELLIESSIGGRPIATFRLREGIQCPYYRRDRPSIEKNIDDSMDAYPNDNYTDARHDDDDNHPDVIFLIDIIEIPSPKPGRPYSSGLEHVEFVIPTTATTAATNNDTSTTTTTTTTTTTISCSCPLNDALHQESLMAFMEKHPLSPPPASGQQHRRCGSGWDTKAMNKTNNPDISLELEDLEGGFGTCTVKFHLMPLEKVIEWEKQQNQSSRAEKLRNSHVE